MQNFSKANRKKKLDDLLEFDVSNNIQSSSSAKIINLKLQFKGRLNPNTKNRLKLH